MHLISKTTSLDESAECACWGAETKPRHLGYFHDEVEGARAYDLAAVQLRASAGAERYLNFPQDLEAYLDYIESQGQTYNFDSPGMPQ